MQRLSSFNFNKIWTAFCHQLMDWQARNNDALFIHIDVWELCSVTSNDSALTLSFGIIVYHPLVRLSHPVVWSGSWLGIRRTGQLEGTLFESAHLNQDTSTGRSVFRTHRGTGVVNTGVSLTNFMETMCFVISISFHRTINLWSHVLDHKRCV